MARLADGFHFVGTPEVYAEYAEALQRRGRDPQSIPIYDSREFWVAETAEQAWEEAKDHLFYSYSNYAVWRAAADVADGRPPGPAPWSTPEDMLKREEHMLFLGDPADVVSKFKQRQAKVPITDTIMRAPPGMEHHKVFKCMELVARDVMPYFSD